MSKTITIDECMGCPHHYSHHNGHKCALTDKWVIDTELHPDCPLPDSKGMVPLDDVIEVIENRADVFDNDHMYEHGETVKDVAKELRKKYGVK